ncbi:unnamed protein product, partial [Rotaria magnacalcarata]
MYGNSSTRLVRKRSKNSRCSCFCTHENLLRVDDK